MPDFFLDRIVSLDFSTQEFAKQVDAIVQRKGGSIDGVPQADQRGGNAVNVASALAALDVQVTPIICTSKLGLEILRLQLQHRPIDLSHVKLRPTPSITTALEFKAGNGKNNVMVRDLGSLQDFSPDDLTDSDYELIKQADYLCLFNWAGTLNHGTELAETVFRKAKANANCKTYLDTADPTPNKARIPELTEKVLKSSNVDILSVNENEACTYAAQLDEAIAEKIQSVSTDKLASEAARTLAQMLPARIDLHTTTFAATFRGKKETVVPAFSVEALRATGAGDAWDAGNILGDANGLSAENRLTLANAVSACYLSSPNGKHPTREKLLQFLKQAQPA